MLRVAVNGYNACVNEAAKVQSYGGTGSKATNIENELSQRAEQAFTKNLEKELQALREGVNNMNLTRKQKILCGLVMVALLACDAPSDKGADVDVRDENGDTQLHIAARYNAHKKAAQLIDKGADMSAKDRNGNTPLHLAASHGAYETADLLIDKGADVNAGGVLGMTPLMVAVMKMSRATAKTENLLRGNGARLNR